MKRRPSFQLSITEEEFVVLREAVSEYCGMTFDNEEMQAAMVRDCAILDRLFNKIYRSRNKSWQRKCLENALAEAKRRGIS